jgi:hypothetical protein
MLLHGRLTADLGIGTGTETLGDVAAHLQRRLDRRLLQGLGVGVRADKVHAINPGREHVRDGIAAATPDAQHLDDGVLAKRVH